MNAPRSPLFPLFALLLTCSAASAANFVFDSSFEAAVGAGTIADGWTSMGTPPGGENSVTTARARTGRFSHQLVVPDAAPVEWYQVRQSVSGLRPGDTVTLSAYVASDNIRDGSGAYCSLNCFAGNDRIGIFDAPMHAAGTTDWQRQIVTATIPERTNEIVVILTVHGHGTGWFDDVQLEQSTEATEYRLSELDVEVAERAQVQRQEAETLATTLHAQAGRLGTVAILRDDLPADGCASSPERLGQWLQGAGYGITYLNAEQLANPFILRGPASGAEGGPLPPFDLLVLAYGGAFPAPAANALKAYLRQGGAFMSTGGYAFDTLLVKHEGRWYAPQDLPLPEGTGTSLLSFDSGDGAAEAKWSLGSDKGGVMPVLATAPGPRAGTKAMRFTVTPLSMWATANRDVSALLPLPDATGGRQWTVTRFWARGDAGTPKFAFEWDEADGSRWKINLPLTTEWKEYVLTPGDLTYWHDNPSVGRGGAGDRFHSANARNLGLGVALDIVERGQPHAFEIADLRVQADPLQPLRERPKCLNTRTGRIRDAMWPEPDQIPVFDPASRLDFVAGARPAGGQFVATGKPWPGSFTGYSATAMLSNQGHGFGPNLSRLVPLLQATDRFGRHRGWLGSIVYHYDGFYRGSAAAFFGVTNTDLFTPQNPQARELLASTASALLRRVYVHDTDTEFSCYRPGETVRFRTKASNHGRQAARGEVRVQVAAEQDGQAVATFSRPVDLQPGSTADLSFDWPVPQAALPLYHFSATVLVDGKPVDREDNAVVIWQPRPASPRLANRGPYFTIGDRSRFLLGSQAYWGQNGSVTARSPLAFERDFGLMQDYGMHFSRLFVPFRTDPERRQSDAMVQLAQQHHIVFYHATNLSNTPVAAELAEQAEISRHLAERYRDVPWLAVDVCNEPTFTVDDARLVEPFNAWLRERYGTNEALRAAWGDQTVELGKLKPERLTDRWNDLRSYDTNRFIAEMQQRWAENSRNAIKAVDPGRLVSVGLMQGFGDVYNIWEPPLCHANLDFTDRHYYGPPTNQPSQLKDIDQRVLGKPLVQGECGAKNHPTFAAADPWGMGDDDERFNHRFEYLVHHAFGLGGAALASWHWRDPPEGIFPCGQVRPDAVPRPSASVMRAMGLTFGRLKPVYQCPEVVLLVPEMNRLGGSRARVIEAIHRAQDVLVSCHVDYGVLSEARLSDLPREVKALVYPVPYCPSDDVVAALRAFVERGGALYLSGDISYDPSRKLTRATRLTELAGVERTGSVDATASPVTTPITIQPRGATVLQQEPMVTLNRLGQGQVMFCATPVETQLAQPPWHRDLYLGFLMRARIDRNSVLPDDPKLECYRVPLEDGGEAFVLYNGNEDAAQATLTLTVKQGQPLKLDLAPMSSGLVVADAQGRILALETQGKVTRGAETLLQARGHVIAQSLDGRDLSEARQVLVLPFPGRGKVPPLGDERATVILPALAGKRVELGELRQTRWTRLEPLKPDARGNLSYDGEQALQMILAAPPAEFAAACKSVEGLTSLL